ncbi:MAG TPA: hypothetical protein VJ419_02725, partial [Gaiellaceae bacterium]|nr:hypothetical protein [Gaiellaceae bacterium]
FLRVATRTLSRRKDLLRLELGGPNDRLGTTPSLLLWPSKCLRGCSSCAIPVDPLSVGLIRRR